MEGETPSTAAKMATLPVPRLWIQTHTFSLRALPGGESSPQSSGMMKTLSCVVGAVLAGGGLTVMSDARAEAPPVPAASLKGDTRNFPKLGTIHRLDPRLDDLLAPDAVIEVIAAGFDWCEGPVWRPDAADEANGGHLLFSEIPSNTVRRWDEGKGLSVYLPAAGYTGHGRYSREPGSNGLALDPQGRLVSCEHGDRRVSVLTPGGGKRTLADHYQGQRFHSPNDLTISRRGDIYFTDPPYGLPQGENDPSRELSFYGVFRIAAGTGEVTLVTDKMTRPNGIALSPDEKTLYVAQSDGRATLIMAFPVQPDGSTGEGRVFKDMTPSQPGMKGSCDGLKVDARGNLWATAPGGLHIITPEGEVLGRLETGEFISNCAFGGRDGTTLFFTNDMYVCRVQTKVRGAR